MSSRGLLTLVLLGILGGGYWLLDTGGSDEPSIAIMQTGNTVECRPAESVLLGGRGWSGEGELGLWTNDVLRFRVCDPGILRFTARGALAKGHAAHVVVSLGVEALWDGEVLAPRDFELRVPESGWLTIAFVNDYRDASGDRNLWISDLRYIQGDMMP